MPRPERPIDVADGPVQQFAAELRQLRQRAGGPGYREMARRAHYSVTSLAEAASGRRLPTLAVALAYVEACGGDRAEWQARWQAVATRIEWPVVHGTGPVEADANPPYRGLAAYQPEDAEWFFGREDLVAELMERLADERFVAVFGPSGSGKSSLLRAGLVPTLKARSRPRQVVVMSPGAHPLTELANRLDPPVAQAVIGSDRLSASIRHGLADHPEHAELVLVVDQFEEVFALCLLTG